MVLTRITLIMASAALMSACAAQQFSYEAQPRFGPPAAQTVIRQVFEEQPQQYRPLRVEFTNDALRLQVVGFRSDFASGATAVVTETEAYYFSNLAEPKLFQKRATWRVLLASGNGLVKRLVIFTTYDRAKEFLDAIASLRKK